MSKNTYRVNADKVFEFAGYTLASLEDAAAGHEGRKVEEFARDVLARLKEHGYVREAELTELGGQA